MHSHYQVFKQMSRHKPVLKAGSSLENGMGLARWFNDDDHIALDKSEHHTLSLYVADGFECYRKTPHGWRNGGAPGRFCLMPKDHESAWDIRGPLEFVHLYFTDQHLKTLSEQVWNKSPSSLLLDEKHFAEDASITLLYHQFLLNLNWQERSDQLALSSATTLLLIHLLKTYAQCNWQLPQTRGGLAPYQLKRVLEYIESHLNQPLLLRDLAAQACLSEYHFSRMFRQSQGLAPHQYVLHRRLQRAEMLLKETSLPLVDIALECGFSSSSHLSNRFRQVKGVQPSYLRKSLTV
ncbi:AraC family transcriptional regulator [Nitrincola tibetensis]|uniref:AraC family transcriptional regulator n=1 Tax=Nitrincola tibetensis TaxID=2219697 RepID=A0A364NPA7_9GAMM|nr:AraC family transcriptional regulator [Nitrincola tibetensis]RAU18840.1 AraC family transcriptional regulator [Nitrincola tibetensis]